MEQKTWGPFSGAQLTAIVGFVTLAVAVPSGVWAVASYTNVALMNPGNGTYALIDAKRRLLVTDGVADLASDPANFVRITGSCGSSASGLSYSPPTGKALIVTAADFSYFAGTAGSDNYVYLDGPAGYIAGLDGSDPTGAKNSDLGTGYYIRHGESLSLSCRLPATYEVSVVGYLVASGAVPPVAPVPAGQSVDSHTTKDGKRL
jgi:hypothetical protein